MSTTDKDFKVKNGLVVGGNGSFDGPVTVGTPTGPTHAATKDYVDVEIGLIELTPGPTGPTGAEGLEVGATAPASTDVLWLDTTVEGVMGQGPTGPTGATGPTGPTGASASDLTAWTSYTPTITADGGGFSLNNGTASGRYKQIGKTVFFHAKFVFGSTTSAGTGHWNFGLPVTAQSPNFTFSAAILDDGNAWYGGLGNGNYTGSTTSFAVIIPGTSASVTTWATVGNGGPFIWTAGDNITISGSYEAA